MFLTKHVRSRGIGEQAFAPTRVPGGTAGAPLTLYSADTPLSVSRRELHGNCPVTLYKFTEKLGDNGRSLAADSDYSPHTFKATDSETHSGRSAVALQEGRSLGKLSPPPASS